MKFIDTLVEGSALKDIYLCKFKQSAVTRNGKPYYNVILMDRTGTLEAKIWEPDSPGIADFDAMDYIHVFGEVNKFQGALQASIKRVQVAREGEYNAADYIPVSKFDREEMKKSLIAVISTVKNTHLNQLLNKFFVEDTDLAEKFFMSSAAKNIHHSFIGGLLQHTLAVTRLCKYFVKAYPHLNHDLLITAALLHDVGKVKELSAFPQNDYTDDGQLLGHIVIGCEMIGQKAGEIPDFPPKLETELKHCILAHHGEYEFGSPKKPALMEAMALNFADNADAKLEVMVELIESHDAKAAVPSSKTGEWFGFNRIFDSNLRKSGEWD
ncbi:MAG: HD domain-containing protein [Lachnospiraceae bacterium]|nr:HD domain-containing protein [Lachnospiraceae bacterium]